MKVQVIVPFAPRLGVNYNVGDELEIDTTTAKSLIASGYVVEGNLELFQNLPQLVKATTKEPSPSAPVSAPVKAETPKKPVRGGKANRRETR